jgi:23S rRNA pseudouridine2605 synthase
MAEERLQKILARAGIASRRKAELLITAGRVRVDGKVIKELGAKANPKRCSIELDGKRLEPEPLCYGILHKPRGMVTTLSDPEGRPTAHDVLRQVGVRVVPVGRLDFNTTGALLFTNDGDFAQALQHARGKAPKVYAAKVTRKIDEKNLELWAQSIPIEGKATRPAAVRVLRREGEKTWLQVTIEEGRNRQVRRLGEHAGTPVERLARLSHAGIGTEGLRPGEWRLLTLDELKALKNSFGVPEKLRGMLELPRGAKGGAFRPRTPPKRAVSGATPRESQGPAEARRPGTRREPSGERSTRTSPPVEARGPRKVSPTKGGPIPRDGAPRAGGRGAGARGAGKKPTARPARGSARRPQKRR